MTIALGYMAQRLESSFKCSGQLYTRDVSHGYKKKHFTDNNHIQGVCREIHVGSNGLWEKCISEVGSKQSS